MCVWKFGPYLRSRLSWQSVKFQAGRLHHTPLVLTPLDNASADILPSEIALASLVLQSGPLGGRIGRFGSSEGPTAWRCLSVDANEPTGVAIGPADPIEAVDGAGALPSPLRGVVRPSPLASVCIAPMRHDATGKTTDGEML